MTKLAVDAGAWVIAVPAAAVLRHDFMVDSPGPPALLLAGLLAAELHVAVGLWLLLRRGRARYASFEDAVALWTCTAFTATALFLVNLVVLGRMIAVATPLVAGPVALALMVVPRAAARLGHLARPDDSAATEPVLVFGAGHAGSRLVEAMRGDRRSPYRPVAVFDDDPQKHDLRIFDVPVRGGRDRMAEVAAETGASLLVVAIPSASAELIRGLIALAAATGLAVRVLPPVGELLGRLDLSQLRPVTDRDLLGRREIDTDIESIAGYLAGRRVLVTGAGGSIGSELCRQLATAAPARLVMLDRDESALHAVQLSIHGRALLDSDDLVVADIRDRERLDEVFALHRPEVVFHAAALKHLPLLERHPGEAVKTNVLGTIHVLGAAIAAGVDRFVNISTDKAADPISVLGYTKRIGERLTAAAAATTGRSYLSVRFGNVLGSRGSVLTAFRAQIQGGGPVTVTDPDVTRYFMTVEEAVQLVVQAGAIGDEGEVLVLDMGWAVPIAEIAQRLIDASGRQVPITFTGLRAGEKRHEALFGRGERDRRPVHPLISHVDVPPLAPDDVLDGGPSVDAIARRLPWLAVRPAAAGSSSFAVPVPSRSSS